MRARSKKTRGRADRMPDRCSLEDVKNIFLGHPIRSKFALYKVNMQIEDSNPLKALKRQISHSPKRWSAWVAIIGDESDDSELIHGGVLFLTTFYTHCTTRGSRLSGCVCA